MIVFRQKAFRRGDGIPKALEGPAFGLLKSVQVQWYRSSYGTDFDSSERAVCIYIYRCICI